MAGFDRTPAWLADWFRQWRQPLRRYLARRQAGSAADIEDIAQEVYLRVLRYDRAELVDHPQAYLFKVAANVSAEWAMRSSRRLQHDSAWLEELVDADTPESEFERVALDRELKAAIATLPPRAREMLRLHFSENKTYPQIALALGVTRKMVKRDLARAYAMLRMRVDLRPPGDGAQSSRGRESP